MIAAAVHGFILALGLIFPLGVQNVFVFNQGALHKRYRKALPVVLTASVCDTLLILLAVLGVSVIVMHSFWIKTVLLVGGVCFLIFMGWTTWNSKPDANNGEVTRQSFMAGKQIAFAASVSLLNPHAILDTVGVIGTSSLQYAGNAKLVYTLACIVVSWLWFFGLAMAGRLTGDLDKSGRFLHALNKFSALVMWGAAVYIVCTQPWHYLL